MNEETVSIIGWLGVVLCSLAFLLLNLKVLKVDNLLYQLLNVFGGTGLVISAFYFADAPNLAVNLVWVLIALFGVIRYARQLSKRNGRSSMKT